jgi:hypothetical protein
MKLITNEIFSPWRFIKSVSTTEETF